MEGVRWDDLDRSEIEHVSSILDQVLNRNGETDDCYTTAEGIVGQAAVSANANQPLTRNLLDMQLWELQRIDGENIDPDLREEALDRLCVFYGI